MSYRDFFATNHRSLIIITRDTISCNIIICITHIIAVASPGPDLLVLDPLLPYAVLSSSAHHHHQISHRGIFANMDTSVLRPPQLVYLDAGL